VLVQSQQLVVQYQGYIGERRYSVNKRKR
jgi:hypothetical protein